MLVIELLKRLLQVLLKFRRLSKVPYFVECMVLLKVSLTRHEMQKLDGKEDPESLAYAKMHSPLGGFVVGADAQTGRGVNLQQKVWPR